MIGAGVLLLTGCAQQGPEQVREEIKFTKGWQFTLDEISSIEEVANPEISWRALNLPHDWSIEGEFSEDHPAGFSGGALPGGIGWYKKQFVVPESDSGKHIDIRFDGVYMNSEVWINGEYLGIRPYGYISFTYDLTSHIKFGEENEIVVKVDNSVQPNSRWYSGSGIYRNVWLTKTGQIHMGEYGTYVTTPEITEDKAEVTVETTIQNNSDSETGRVFSEIWFDGRRITEKGTMVTIPFGESKTITHYMTVPDPELWDVEDPNLYQVYTYVLQGEEKVDTYETTFGIRSFEFDKDNGFFLNGEPLKILGVNNHHDLGALGAAINTRALERQLEIMRGMGVNAIRTSHNPPTPELLELTDEMGFIVMDEAFDTWKRTKAEFDYGIHWDEWHEEDLIDFIKRDRNHPSIIMWSLGNEIPDQGYESGNDIALELRAIVDSLDQTRIVTVGMNPPAEWNSIANSGALDVIGYNYHRALYLDHFDLFPNTPMIGTENVSSLATRGYYDVDIPSDSIRRWPVRWDIPFEGGTPEQEVSAYDHVSAPWGSTNEETWKIVKENDFISGMFIWTGFDYLGEPTPYRWPSRSSYFGIVDLAGFPKDTYYMYKSEWTDEKVLHVFPHWNWNEGDTVDIWAYYNHADEVELFLNGESLGKRTKEGDDLHVEWRVPFEAGVLTAVSRKDGEQVLEKEIRTAGEPAQIRLTADRSSLSADGEDLSFIKVEVLDENGTLVPRASNLINFEIKGPGFIAGVDNGSQTSHESFKANYRKAFNGLALAIVQTEESAGTITFTATSEGLESDTITLKTNQE
jgi:beta-galactosidase